MTYTAGIDVGSTYTKAVILDQYDRIVIGDRIVYLPLRGATAAAPTD